MEETARVGPPCSVPLILALLVPTWMDCRKRRPLAVLISVVSEERKSEGLPGPVERQN